MKVSAQTRDLRPETAECLGSFFNEVAVMIVGEALSLFSECIDQNDILICQFHNKPPKS